MRNKRLPQTAGNTAPEPMIEMNMTPLIDVMLVLIIMLIVTIPRQNHAIEHSLGGDNGEQETVDVVVVEVDFDGTLMWNGLALAGRAALAAKLEGAAASATPVEVHVKANRLAPYKAVAQLMSRARRAGVTRIGLVGNEHFL